MTSINPFLLNLNRKSFGTIKVLYKMSQIKTSDHLKTTQLCKHAVTKLLYLLRCVPLKCKTQQMCNKRILELFRT